MKKLLIIILLSFISCGGSGNGGSSDKSGVPPPSILVWSPLVSPLNFSFTAPAGEISNPQTIAFMNLNYGDGSKIHFIIWDETSITDPPGLVSGLPTEAVISTEAQIDILIQASCASVAISRQIDSYLAVSYIDSVAVPREYNYIPYSLTCQ